MPVVRAAGAGQPRRLGGGPQLGESAAGPGGRASRFGRQVLARGDGIGRGERPRSLDRRPIISTLDQRVEVACGQCALERGANIVVPGGSAEARIGRVERPFGLPPAVGGHRNPIVGRREMAHTPRSPNRIAVERLQLAAGRGQPGRGEQQVGQADVAGEAPAAVGLGRTIEPVERLADELPSVRRTGRHGGLRLAASSASSPKLKLLSAVEDETVDRPAFLFVDVPASAPPPRRASIAPSRRPRATAARRREPRSRRR